jgi:hypothetical protein
MRMRRIVLSLSLSLLLLAVPHLSTLSWVSHVPILLPRWTFRLVLAAHSLLLLLLLTTTTSTSTSSSSHHPLLAG